MAGTPGFLRRAFTQRLELKFLALIIALAIFYSRERQESAERTLQVDLMVTGQESAEHLVRVSPLPATIEIAVRGPSSAVAGLRAEQVGPVAIPIREAVTEGRVELRRDMFTLPESVRLLWASPAAITFRFEPLADKTLSVVPQLGPADPDIAVDHAALSVDPPQVRISGPQSAVQPLVDARTELVALAGLAPGTFTQTVRLLLADDAGLTLSADRVRVRVELRPDTVESQRTGVPVEVVRGTDFDPRGLLVYGAEGLRADVVVRGLRRVVEQLDSSQIKLFVRADPSLFTDQDGNGVQEAALSIEAEHSSDEWSVVSITPPTLSMTWVPPPAAPAEPADGDGGTAPDAAP